MGSRSRRRPPPPSPPAAPLAAPARRAAKAVVALLAALAGLAPMAPIAPIAPLAPLAALAALAAPAALGRRLAAEEVRDVLGSAHAGGTYNFTPEDYLDEGADQLLTFGTRVIKVWLTPDVATLYPFNSNWSPPAANVTELAQKPYFQSLFAKPFTTYLLVIQPAAVTPPFLSGLSAADAAAESQQMHDLARYLLTAYAGSGKTFVLQNWEGDHLLRSGLAAGVDPARVRLQGMIDWWNARQDGVARARAEVGENGVRVAHAAEVNQLADAMAGKVTAVNDVVPYTHADLYSYSSWDIGFDPQQLTLALDYLRAKAPPSALYGRGNVYLGEYGAAKDQVPPGETRRGLIDELTETALAWGVRWAVYWQVYDNEAYGTIDPLVVRPTADQLRGFWLIRPDGVKAAYYPDLHRRLAGDEWRIVLRSSSGQYLSAPPARGGGVRVHAHSVGAWEVWNAVDPGGGSELRSGSRVYLQTHGGRYLAVAAGSGDLEAGPQQAPAPGHPPAAFVLRRVAGDGVLVDGDAVVVETADGRPLAVDFASGAVFAGTTGEVFRVQYQ
jgi:hypothetical protein